VNWPTSLVLGALVGVASVFVSTSTVSAAKSSVPHLQVRPVLAELPSAGTPGAGAAPASGAAIASCDANAVLALGESAPTTKAKGVEPDECVLLSAGGGLPKTGDDARTRYFLGPSKLDASDVEKATARFAPGSGWTLQLSLTAAGRKAFDALAEQQFHNRLAVVADGTIIFAPTIQPANATFESFDGSVVASGLTQRRAKELARSITKWKKSG
jgi:hypothetical protein